MFEYGYGDIGRSTGWKRCFVPCDWIKPFLRAAHLKPVGHPIIDYPEAAEFFSVNEQVCLIRTGRLAHFDCELCQSARWRVDLDRVVGKYRRRGLKRKAVAVEEIINRMAGVPKEKGAEEGIKIACEQIEELREIEGIAGIHLMAIEWEHRVHEIVEKAKLLPRPSV